MHQTIGKLEFQTSQKLMNEFFFLFKDRISSRKFLEVKIDYGLAMPLTQRISYYVGC